MTSFKVNCGLVFVIFCWASAFVGIRIGLTSYSPGSLALFRFLIASTLMTFLYSQLPNKKKIPWPDRLQLMLLGLIGLGVYNVSLNYGELSVPAGVASFIVGLMPLFTVLLAVILLHERPKPAVYIGIAISFFGLVLIGIAESQGASVNTGMLIILIAAVMGAIYTVYQKRFLQRYHPIAVTTWIIWGGTLSLVAFAPTLSAEIGGARIEATLAVVYLGIFPAAIAYLCWGYILQFLPVSSAALYLYATPVVSTGLGFLVLHEQPSTLSLVGGLLALAGALYATRYRQRLPTPLGTVD